MTCSEGLTKGQSNIAIVGRPTNRRPLVRAAGWLYALASALVIGFQVALATGAPWGVYAMGGSSPGRLPPALRAAALVQAALLCGLAAVVLSRAGVAWPSGARLARRVIWVVVAVSALSLLLNLITPSEGERRLWAPVALLLLATSTVVALTPADPPRP
jgi:hypothetical protein